jgi:hypothetical protein
MARTAWLPTVPLIVAAAAVIVTDIFIAPDAR